MAPVKERQRQRQRRERERQREREQHCECFNPRTRLDLFKFLVGFDLWLGLHEMPLASATNEFFSRFVPRLRLFKPLKLQS